jgi:uncharacterized protein YbjQ (UPF0145 family)
MIHHALSRVRAGGVAAALAVSAVAVSGGALPAFSQTPANLILVSESDGALAQYVVVGPVSATVHQKSLFPTEPSRVLLERALQAEAAKLGADAVIQVRYDMVNALTSRDGHKAMGVAVKYVQAPAQTAPQIAQVVSPPVAAPPAPAAAPVAPPEGVPTPPVPASPPAAVQMAEAQPAPAVAPVQAPVPAAPVASAVAPPQAVPYVAMPPMPTGAPGQILLSEHDIPQRPHQRLGQISVKAHQTSMFPKTSPTEQLNEALRAEAAKLGADAVVLVKYTYNNAMFSRKGNTATGVAVKFR